MGAIKSFFMNLKYNTEGKVALASIIVNIILIIIMLNILCTGDVPGYTPRAELEAQATECTLEHVDPDATTTTTTEETDVTSEDEDSASTTTANNNNSSKTTTKNNGGNSTTKKSTTTTSKTTTTTKNSGDNDVGWSEGWV